MKRLLLLTSTAALALATSAWAAAPAPSVATSAAGGLGPTRATFAGSVNPNGAQTQWYFQYGTTPAYGQTTPRETIAASFGWRNVDVAVGGLSADASYHFRIVASSSSGTSIGADESFATPGALPGLDDARGDRTRRRKRTPQRLREPERTVDRLLLRLRDDERVRGADADLFRRIGQGDARRRRRPGPAQAGDDLRLRARRVQRRRDDDRRRSELDDVRRPGRPGLGAAVAHPRLGHPYGDGRYRRRGDELALRLRDDDQL